MKTELKERTIRRFGSRKVLIVHLLGLILTVLTMLLSITFWVISENHGTAKMLDHLMLCVFAIGLLNIPIFLRTKLNFRIPSFLHIVVTVFIIAHCVLGEIYRFYDHILFYDKILHITAGIVIATLGFSIVYAFSRTESSSVQLSPFFVALFSFCFALALLVLWEVFEFGMDCLFDLNMQRYQNGLIGPLITSSDGDTYMITNSQGSGLIDTMEDLIIGTIGAAAICVAGGISVKKYPDSTRFYITKGEKVERGKEATAIAGQQEQNPQNFAESTETQE